MKGFLFDENLPGVVALTPSLPVRHVRELGASLTDQAIWEYAASNDLVIVTKDADFSDRMLSSEPPPRVVHLRFGNMRLAEFNAHLAYVWPRIEVLLHHNKLLNVYRARIEAIQ